MSAVTCDQRTRVLVVTIVHHPHDARIAQRQIASLIGAGMAVTYIAPFSAYGVRPPAGVAAVDVPRALGRRRLKALLSARRLILQLAPEHDIVIVHDPELTMAVAGVKDASVVWDVHEDTAAAIEMRVWLPRWLRRPVASVIHRVQARAESKMHLMLAEEGYLPLFESEHPIVPNTTVVPAEVEDPDRPRAVYLGSITPERGAFDLIETARLLAPDIEVVLIGPAHDPAKAPLREAHSRGEITWLGFQPNDEALQTVRGSLVGLSLLHDEANYRHSLPTKLIEYLAHGVPVISTPLSRAHDFLEDTGGGIIVPFEDPQATAGAIRALAADPARRYSLARDGHDAVLHRYNWTQDGQRFVELIRRWAKP